MFLKSKKIIIFLIFTLVMCGGVFFIARQKESFKEYTKYTCADNKTVDISTYRNKIKVVFDDKKHVVFRMDLTNGIASRYVSNNPKMTLWINDTFIMIEDVDSVPYYDCSVDGPKPEDIENPSLEIPADQVQYAPQ